MRSTGLLALALALIPTALGCGDDIKFPDPGVPDPALNGVFPAKGFTSRTIRVQISGDGTEFVSGATVAFGAGITVGAVELSSPSDLFTNITIAADAVKGPRDVVVTNGGASLTLTQAFTVADPIEIIPEGPLLQGGFGNLLVINHDSENPFLGTLVVESANPGTTVFLDANTDFTANVFVELDTDAATAQLKLTDTLIVSTVSTADLTVTPRAATPLTPPVNGAPGDFSATTTLVNTSALFSFTNSALVTGDVSTTDINGAPFMVFLEGGKWSKARGFVSSTFDNSGGVDPIPVTPDMFVVVVDIGAQGYSFDLNIHQDVGLPGVVQITETEPNEDNAQAQTAATAVSLYRGTLGDINDADFIKVSATAGQTIRVRTTSGLTGGADTDPFVFDSAGTQLASSGDNFLSEDITTAPVATTGDYFVAILPSFFANATGEGYEAAIVVEDAVTFAGSHAPVAHPPLTRAPFAFTRRR